MTIENASPICITRYDARNLRKLIDERYSYIEQINENESNPLIIALDNATIVASNNISRNVVTMNSRIAIINQYTSERQTFTLVFPKDTNLKLNKFSVLDPIGSDLLGRRVGDEFEIESPIGKQTYIIAKIIQQPEAQLRATNRLTMRR
ncbi:GreA/GreB family elongation factor [Pelagicoccus sp. SDUM812002]|uniref:GreA/GreB family elongation factor n=1 Tax=Pelagicoccus sp. SDUM812002 TaxID=3041266 RepID=UPI00280E49A7|nr:GreA/GreB family elongation factor [Pelagicoccus sp. SDUM812002]MDQ8184599.1 GreA/GreB family elongation factor [Pelagicoccus sp. SDUM812002]